MRYSLRPRVFRYQSINRPRANRLGSHRRLAYCSCGDYMELHVRVNSVTQAMIDRQMATPRLRGPGAGVNERLHYEAKARCILTYTARHLTRVNVEETLLPRYFPRFFLTPPPHSPLSFEPPRCLCKGGLLCISRPLAKTTYY